MEALRSSTIQNAYAAFEEDLKGTLSIGKLADITVLTRDITVVPEDEITAVASRCTRSSGDRSHTRR